MASLPPLKAPGSKPLEGVRVLEFTRVIAGAVAGRLLAELGATIVKVIDKDLVDFAMLQVWVNAISFDHPLTIIITGGLQPR